MDAASGAVAVNKNVLREMLANCTAFRTWDGNDWSVAEARDRIYLDGLPIPPNATEGYTRADLLTLRPFAIVFYPQVGGIRWTKVAAVPDCFAPSGTLIVRLFRDVPDDLILDPAAADRQFENTAGLMVSTGDMNAPGLAELSGSSGYLDIKSVQLHGPFHVPEDEIPTRGHEQMIELVLDWGTNR